MYYLGVDVGGTNIAVGVVDENNAIIAKASQKTPVPCSEEVFCDKIVEVCSEALGKANLTFDDVPWIGIGCPGTVNRATGILEFANNLYFKNFKLREMMAERTNGKLVILENDANAAAYGEYQAGALAGADNAIAVTLGTGLGGGIIINHKIYSGSNFAGGEIGHITVDRHETATCGCGKHGCLEQYSSATGVVRCMKKLLDENPDTPCTLRGTEFAAKDVFDAARNGDALAAREVDEMTDTLGMALATIAATADPEMFMIGGGVSRAGEVLFAPLREHFKVYAFKSCRETPIVPAILGNDAGIYGSVRLIVGE